MVSSASNLPRFCSDSTYSQMTHSPLNSKMQMEQISVHFDFQTSSHFHPLTHLLLPFRFCYILNQNPGSLEMNSNFFEHHCSLYIHLYDCDPIPLQCFRYNRPPASALLWPRFHSVGIIHNYCPFLVGKYYCANCYYYEVALYCCYTWLLEWIFSSCVRGTERNLRPVHWLSRRGSWVVCT